MARLVFTLEDGTTIETELDSDAVTIGRHPDSVVVLPSASVSGHHATVKRRGDAFYVQDLGTTNGTKLNGVEVEEAKLEDGDKLFFGDVPATVQLKDAPVKKKPVADDAPPAKASAKPAPGRGAPRRSYRTSYQQSAGCAGFIILLVFLFLAFIAGLFIRHAMEGRGFLLTDAVERLKDKFGGSETSPASKKKDGKDAKSDDKKNAPEKKNSDVKEQMN